MQYSLGVEEVGIRQRGPSSRRWETKAQVKPPAVRDEQAEAHTGLRKPELMFESGAQIPRLLLSWLCHCPASPTAGC